MLTIRAKAYSLYLLACVRIVGKHFKQFYCRQFKHGQLDEMLASVRNVNKMCFYALC